MNNFKNKLFKKMIFKHKYKLNKKYNNSVKYKF